MNKVREVIRFHRKICSRSTRYLAPFILLLVLLYNMYYAIPVQLVSSFSVSAFAVFVLMSWIGYTYANDEDEVTTQILMLRVNNDRLYYLADVLLQFMISVLISIITVGFPLVQNMLHGFGMYKRPVTLLDVVAAFLLTLAAAFLGACTGMLFSHRIFRDAKLNMALAVLFVTLAIAKSGVVKLFPASRYLLWILPPVSDTIVMNTQSDYYTPILVVSGVFIMLVYSIVLAILRAWLLSRRRF